MMRFRVWLEGIEGQIKFIGFPDGKVFYGRDDSDDHGNIWMTASRYAEEHFPKLARHDPSMGLVLSGAVREDKSAAWVNETDENVSMLPAVINTLIKDGRLTPQSVLSYFNGRDTELAGQVAGSAQSAPEIKKLSPEEEFRQREERAKNSIRQQLRMRGGDAAVDAYEKRAAAEKQRQQDLADYRRWEYEWGDHFSDLGGGISNDIIKKNAYFRMTGKRAPE